MEISLVIETYGFQHKSINSLIKKYIGKDLVPISIASDALKYGINDNAQVDEINNLFHICLEKKNPNIYDFKDSLELLGDEFLYVGIMIDGKITYARHYYDESRCVVSMSYSDIVLILEKYKKEQSEMIKVRKVKPEPRRSCCACSSVNHEVAYEVEIGLTHTKLHYMCDECTKQLLRKLNHTVEKE